MSLVERLRAMSADELRFRLTCEARKSAGRVRSALVQPTWRRAALAGMISPSSVREHDALSRAQGALRQGDMFSAHRALAAHFAERAPRFPLDPRTLDALSTRISRRFPAAISDASARADRILQGRYDLLGYVDLAFGHPPAWHRDPVHDRTAPEGFWSSLDYLAPESGDHKVIWEINRHQHWLTLARAHRLTRQRQYYAAFVDQLEDWIARNPPLQGVNWASMLELAFRSLSWLWSLHFFAGAAGDDPQDAAPWTVDLLLGLDRQLTHIEHNLSTYFSPNTHISGEGLALYVAGRALPELSASGRRAALGRRVLLEEISRQITDDGGHAERSSHYHRYSTEFYLLATLVARATNDDAASEFEEAARRQAMYLRSIADDRGRLPLIGDDDGGQLFPMCGREPADCGDTLAAASAILDSPALAVSEIPEEVFWLCGALPLEDVQRARSPWPSTAMTESGYYVSRTPAGDHLVFDAGPHGFLNGGHAHADALSIVLTIAGLPVIVDSGTGTYTMSAEVRDRFRSTAMHNTVVVNGRSQSEPRGPFQWRSTARAESRVWASHSGFDYMEGMHDGYSPIVHVRAVLAVHGMGWVIVDHLLSDDERSASADAFWHVHPDWTPTVGDDGAVILRHPSGAVHALCSSSTLQVLSAGEADGLDAYAPIYGRVARGICIRAASSGPLPRSFATFVAANAGAAPHAMLRPVPVTDSAGPSWHSAAFRVSCGGQQGIILSAVERSPREGPADGPRRLWGIDEARTDGRFAFLPMSGMPAVPPVVIRGTQVTRAMAICEP